jgi:hypothetical protein
MFANKTIRVKNLSSKSTSKLNLFQSINNALKLALEKDKSASKPMFSLNSFVIQFYLERTWLLAEFSVAQSV